MQKLICPSMEMLTSPILNTESIKDELQAKTDKDLSNGEYQKELYTRSVDMQSILGDKLRELARNKNTQ